MKWLQTFLSQFPDIYPEGLVTGFFGPLTESAVKKWQEEHGVESVGVVGPKTIAKINEVLGQTSGASGAILPEPTATGTEKGPTTAPASNASISTAISTSATSTAGAPTTISSTSTTATTTALMCTRDYSACSSKKDCESAGFFWYTVSCHTTPPPPGSCAASYMYCAIGAECSANGWYSCRGSCYASVEACHGQTYLPPAVPSAVSTSTSSSGSGASGAATLTPTPTPTPTPPPTTTSTTTTAAAVTTCAATVINGYSVPSKNSGESVTVTASNQVSNGTRSSSTTFTCSNGSFTAGPEAADITCNSGYTSVGTQCVATASGTSSSTTTATTSADTIPPSTPPDFKFESGAPGFLAFTWRDSTDNVGVTGYKVYLTNTQTNVTTVYSFCCNGQGQSGFAQGVQYAAYVVAIDAAGNVSAPTVTLYAAVVQLTTPTNFTAVATSPTSVSLTWSASQGIVYRYQIRRFTGSLNGAQTSVQVLAPATSYTDATVAPSTSYIYWVQAMSIEYYGSGDANVSVTTPALSSSTASSTTLDLRAKNLAAISQSILSLRIILERLLDILKSL